MSCTKERETLLRSHRKCERIILLACSGGKRMWVLLPHKPALSQIPGTKGEDFQGDNDENVIIWELISSLVKVYNISDKIELLRILNWRS